MDGQKFRDIQAIRFHLNINGKTVQEGCSSDMFYKVDEIISYISQYFTLKTGDLLYTGCPTGCGPVSIDDHLEGRFNGGSRHYPTGSAYAVAASADDSLRHGLVLDRTQPISVPIISGTSVTTAMVETAQTQDLSLIKH